jgi:hypothetical protein
MLHTLHAIIVRREPHSHQVKAFLAMDFGIYSEYHCPKGVFRNKFRSPLPYPDGYAVNRVPSTVNRQPY